MFQSQCSYVVHRWKGSREHSIGGVVSRLPSRTAKHLIGVRTCILLQVY